MATIKDVAALAGISYTTVSHVVNKTRPVSEEVRVKVEAAIKTLDYVPSAVARSLKAKTTATIGLLVPNSINPYFAELARGIEDYCERNGYCVILCNSAKYGLRLLGTNRPMVAVVLALSERATALGT